MDRLIIEITIIIFVFFMGYWMGFNACYRFLMDELKNHKKDSD